VPLTLPNWAAKRPKGNGNNLKPGADEKLCPTPTFQIPQHELQTTPHVERLMYARILAPPATDSKGHFAIMGTNERADVDPCHRLSYALPHGTDETRR
jgi:hypothetical protein